MVLSEEPEISTGDSPLTVPGLSSKHVTGREWSFRVMSFLPVFESQITMHESSEADANLFKVMNHNLTNCKQAKRHGNQWATGTQHAGEHGMRGQSVLLFLEKTKRKKTDLRSSILTTTLTMSVCPDNSWISFNWHRLSPSASNSMGSGTCGINQK